MKDQRSILRRAYDGIALFALLNLLGLVSLAAFAVHAGAIDAEKARRIVAVMRGEHDDDAEDHDAEPARTTARGPATVDGGIVESEIDKEILRRESERIKAELDQRLALNNTIMLRVTAAREQFQKEREQARQQRRAALANRQDEGFQKQVQIFESMSPKTAAKHLLAMSDVDQAATLLLEMQTRSARRIVEAARRGEDMEKMRTILQRLREVAPQRSVELEPEEPWS